MIHLGRSERVMSLERQNVDREDSPLTFFLSLSTKAE
jgi:hypothetical protein